MSHLKKFFCCLCLLISVVSASFPQQIQARKKKANSSHSHIRDKKPQALTSLTSEQRALVLIGELLGQAKNFESDFNKPLKIVLFKAKTAEALWQKDEPRARRLFMETFKSAEDFGPSHKNKNISPFANMSTTLRSQILNLALNCDTNFAEELVKSISEAHNVTPSMNDSPNFNLLSQQSTLNLKIAKQIVETDPSRAAQLIKSSFNGWFSNRHIDVLKLLRGKSPALADDTFLYGLSVIRRRANNLSNKIALLFCYVFPRLPFEELKFKEIEAESDYEPSAEVIRTFLEYAYDEFMPKTVEAQINENNEFGRSAFDIQTMQLLVKAFEKYRPERAESFGTRVSEIKAQIHNSNRKDIFAGEEEYYAEMFRQNVEDLLEKAEAEEDQQKKDSFYSDAVRILGTIQNDLDRAFLVSEKIKDQESRFQVLGLVFNIVVGIAIKKGELEKAVTYLKRWHKQQECLGTYVEIANLFIKRNNPQRASQILYEAKQLAEKYGALSIDDYVIELANALSRVDTKQGFEAMKKAVQTINSSIEDRSNSSSLDEDSKLSFPTEFDYEDGFAALGRADFDKALTLAKTIRFKHSSALAQLAVCRGVLRD
jgi:hypothetical protein